MLCAELNSGPKMANRLIGVRLDAFGKSYSASKEITLFALLYAPLKGINISVLPG